VPAPAGWGWWMHVDLLGLLVWLVLGALAGWLAGRVLARSDHPALRTTPFGGVGDAVTGALGAYVGALVLAFASSRGEVGAVVAVTVASLGAALSVILLRGGAIVRPER